MRGKLMFLGGIGVGFVLGARAGRERYEELVRAAQKVKENPTIQEAAGVVQAQATKLYSESKDKLSSSKLGQTKVGQVLNTLPEPKKDRELASVSTPSGTSSTTPSTAATGTTARGGMSSGSGTGGTSATTMGMSRDKGTS
ncbi:MAG TPA: hypothetical protein VF054_20435 [Micromonosporaceae bacterium]